MNPLVYNLASLTLGVYSNNNGGFLAPTCEVTDSGALDAAADGSGDLLKQLVSVQGATEAARTCRCLDNELAYIAIGASVSGPDIPGLLFSLGLSAIIPPLAPAMTFMSPLMAFVKITNTLGWMWSPSSRNSEILYHSHSIKSSRLTFNSITPVSVRQSRQSLRELRVAHSRMRGLRNCWCAWDSWSARGPRRRFIRKRRPRLFEERVHFCRALLGCRK
jgi:hypothetical protein